MGAEIRMSGRIPGKRAKTWRFYKGYLKKCGDVTFSYIDSSIQIAKTKPGIAGIKVSIMHQDTPLPDVIKIKEEVKLEEVTGKDSEEMQKEIKEIVKAQETVKAEIKEEKKEEKKQEENNGDTEDKGSKKTVKKGTDK